MHALMFIEFIYRWPYWIELDAACLFLIGLILQKSYLHSCLIIIRKPQKKYIRLFLSNLKLPLQWILILSSIGLILFHGHLFEFHSLILLNGFQTLLTFLICWGVWRQTTHTKDWIELYNQEFNHSFHEIAVPLIRRGARLIIAIVLIIALSTIWGFSTKNTLTGMGLIGIIISLSSQDLIKNTLSAFFLLFNNVFDIGDWIQVGNTSGLVKSISLRFTKIETYSHGLVSIPNSQIANSNVTNWSQREKRVVKFYFTFDPNCSGDALFKCVNHIQNKLMLNRALCPHSFQVDLKTQVNTAPSLIVQVDVRTPHYYNLTPIMLECYRDITDLLHEYGIKQVQPLTFQK